MFPLEKSSRNVSRKINASNKSLPYNPASNMPSATICSSGSASKDLILRILPWQHQCIKLPTQFINPNGSHGKYLDFLGHSSHYVGITSDCKGGLNISKLSVTYTWELPTNMLRIP